MKSFNIFIKSKKINWTANKIALLVFAIFMIANQLNQNFQSPFQKSIHKSLGLIALAFFIAGVVYRLSKIDKPEKLNGIIDGLLVFNLDSIIIDKKQYNMDEIEKISIVNEDFYGKVTSYRSGFDSNHSNGVDNHLTLTLKNKRRISCMFEIHYQEDIRNLDEILINYYYLGKIDFFRLKNILKLESDEIEDFKRRYNIKTSTR